MGEFREIANKNTVTNWLLNRPHRNHKRQKEKAEGPWPEFVAFVVIAILLWVFIGCFERIIAAKYNSRPATC
jgi:hypothetical protein